MSPVIVHATFLQFGLIPVVSVFKDTGEAPRLSEEKMLGCEGGGPRVRSWVTLISGLLECLGFAGAVFGWATLVFVLKTEGYFSSLCVNATVNGTAVEGQL